MRQQQQHDLMLYSLLLVVQLGCLLVATMAHVKLLASHTIVESSGAPDVSGCRKTDSITHEIGRFLFKLSNESPDFDRTPQPARESLGTQLQS